MSWCYDVTDPDGNQFCFNFCGGSIYNETTIITAAHCCDGIEHDDWPDKKIVAGQLDLLSSSGYEQTKKINSFAMHPDYDPSLGDMSNDICILFLDSPMTFNDNVDKIPLDTMGPTTKETCIVSGWGVFQVKFKLVVKKYFTNLFLKIKGRYNGYCTNSSMGRSKGQIRFWMPGWLLRPSDLQPNYNVLRFRLCK